MTSLDLDRDHPTGDSQPAVTSQPVETSRTKLRRITGNVLLSLVGQALLWVMALALTAAYGRFLGDVRFGELYFATSIVALIGFPLGASFNQQQTRDVAQAPQLVLRYLTAILVMKLLLWVAAYLLLLVFCRVAGYGPEQVQLIVIAGVALLFSSAASTFGSAHSAYERFVFPVAAALIENGFTTAAGILLLRAGAGVTTMVIVLLIGSLLNLIWQASWFVYKLGFSFTVDWPLARALARTSLPFLAYGILGVIYYRVDSVLLSLMTNAQVLGWYGASYQLFDALSMVPWLLVGVVFPVFSKLSVSSQDHLRTAIGKLLNVILLLGIPLAVGTMAASANIIMFLYHRADFVPAIPVLQLLAPGLLFLYVNTVLTTALVSIKREQRVTYMAAAALVFNVALNLVLIPRYQAVAAAAVTSLTELLLLGLGLALLPRHLFSKASLMVAVKSLIASGLMALVVFHINTYPIYVIIPVAVVVYVVVCLCLRALPAADVALFVSALRQKVQPAPESTASTVNAELGGYQ